MSSDGSLIAGLVSAQVGDPGSGVADQPGDDAPLIERDDELARLDALLESVAGGSGVLVTISGDAGIGKTSLLEALRRKASGRGLRVLLARGSELEDVFAFGVVRQWVEPVMLAADPSEREALLSGAAGLAAPLIGNATADAAWSTDHGVLHGLYWLLAKLAQSGPTVLLLDDAQWADAPSLRFLDYLARRLDGLPLLVVAGVRTGQPGAHPTALGRIDDVAEALALAPLSARAVAALVDRGFGVAADPEFSLGCEEATGGNPFYLLSLLRDLRAHAIAPTAANVGCIGALAPRDVRRSVTGRLARLGDDARRLAEAAAVLGDEVALYDAAALAGLPPAAAGAAGDALARAVILRPSGPLAFVHPIVRAAVYEAIAPHDRSGRHAQAARMLESRGAEPGDLALHLVRTDPGSIPDTAPVLRGVARDALTRGAPDVAAAYLERVLGEPLDRAERCEVLTDLGDAQARAGLPGAVEQLERALALAPDPERRARAVRSLALILPALGRTREAVIAIDRELRELAGNEPRLAAALEEALVLTADVDLSVRPLVRHRLAAITPAGLPDGDPRMATWLAHEVVERVLVGRSATVTARLAERALADGRLLSDSLAGGAMYFLMTFALTQADRFDLAGHHLDAVRSAAGRHGAAAVFVNASAQQAIVAVHRGALVDAEADARAAVDAARLNGWRPLTQYASTALIEVLIALGEPELAAGVLVTSEIDPDPGDTVQGTVLLEVRGRLRLELGDFEGAAADLLEAGRRLVSWDAVNPASFAWRSHAALALRRLEDEDRAVVLVAEEVALARVWGAPRALGVALRIDGLLTGGADGLARLEESARVLESSPAVLERARTLIELGGAHRRANRRAVARGHLRTGLELARSCGARALADRALADLRAAGGRARTPRRTGVESLTPSERRVAQMAASGLSNPAIAQSLFVTIKTVEMHLSATYRKLDVGSRAALPAALSLAGAG